MTSDAASSSRALLLPPSFFFLPETVLPLLPMTPLALLLPLLPMTPLALLFPLLRKTPLALLLPPRIFRFEFEDRAFFLKHPIQNFARGEAASFLQRGLLHLLLALVFVLAAGCAAPLHAPSPQGPAVFPLLRVAG